MPEHPKPSPVPEFAPLDGETPTNPGMLIDAGYLKRKLEEEEKRLKNSGWIRTGTGLVVLLAGLGTGLLVVKNEASGAAKQEVAPVVAAHEGIKARLTTLEGRFDRYELKQDRVDTNLELALDVLRVPKAVRPPPVPLLDGGAP